MFLQSHRHLPWQNALSPPFPIPQGPIARHSIMVLISRSLYWNDIFGPFFLLDVFDSLLCKVLAGFTYIGGTVMQIDH